MHHWAFFDAFLTFYLMDLIINLWKHSGLASLSAPGWYLPSNVARNRFTIKHARIKHKTTMAVSMLDQTGGDLKILSLVFYVIAVNTSEIIFNSCFVLMLLLLASKDFWIQSLSNTVYQKGHWFQMIKEETSGWIQIHLLCVNVTKTDEHRFRINGFHVQQAFFSLLCKCQKYLIVNHRQSCRSGVEKSVQICFVSVFLSICLICF